MHTLSRNLNPRHELASFFKKIETEMVDYEYDDEVELYLLF